MDRRLRHRSDLLQAVWLAAATAFLLQPRALVCGRADFVRRVCGIVAALMKY
jgi:hypothetical protein